MLSTYLLTYLIFYCAYAETASILLPVSKLTKPLDPACPKTYWLKRDSVGMLMLIYLSNVKCLPYSLHC